MANCKNTMDFINERDRICNSYNDCNKCPFTEEECEALFGTTIGIGNKQYEKVIVIILAKILNASVNKKILKIL